MLRRMDQATKDALLERLTKMASVGATILSNASAAKRLIESIQALDADAPQPDPVGFGRDAFGTDAFGH